MVKHIVMYTLKEGCEIDEVVEIVRSSLEPLVGKIPGLIQMQIRRSYQGDFDYVLYSVFETAETVTAYRAHALHKAAKKNFAHFLKTRVSADFEV